MQHRSLENPIGATSQSANVPNVRLAIDLARGGIDLARGGTGRERVGSKYVTRKSLAARSPPGGTCERD